MGHWMEGANGDACAHASRPADTGTPGAGDATAGRAPITPHEVESREKGAADDDP